MKYPIKVFKAEKQAGLADKIVTTASVAYVTKVEPLDPNSPLASNLIKSVASELHPADTLYPMKDILVTTGWNLNTDVFDKGETWVARHTPNDHPLNLEHDEKKIVGHIKDSQVVDDGYAPLSEDLSVDELPDKFHILNGSVIYKAWEDPQQAELIAKTIEEIQKGEWYVSMECLFRGFDYAVIRPDGSSAIIQRNEESAWLTKHLRQYNGEGVYKCPTTGVEFKIGRVLRNITFSGKGLVRKPANPESIILNNVSAFVSTFADLGYIKSEAEVTSNKPESQNMAENENQLKHLEDRVATLVKENEQLTSQLKDRDGQAVRAEIDSLKNEVSLRDKKIEALEATINEIKESSAKLEKRVEDAEAAKTAADAELVKLRSEKVERQRLAVLTEKGATPEKAAELVKKFTSFSDEQFNETVELLSSSGAWKKPTKKPEDVINNVRTPSTDASLSTDEPDDKDGEIVAKASKYIGGFLRYAKVDTEK